jgi:hypothetical protein
VCRALPRRSAKTTQRRCRNVAAPLVSDDVRSLLSQVSSGLGNAAPYVIVGGGIIAAWQAIAALYRRGLGSRRDLTGRLNELGCGVTLRYVEERFGTPAFARLFHLAPPAAVPAPRPEPTTLIGVRTARATSDARRSGLPAEQAPPEGTSMQEPMHEYLYRTKHAWLQVIVGETGAVARFSVTVTDPRFKFSVGRLTWGHLNIRLGHSRFSDIDVWEGSLWGRSLRIGAHNHEYAEAYYFGNPGLYQHFVLSANEEGTGAFGYSIAHDGPGFASSGNLASNDALPLRHEFDPSAEYAARFRADTTINTLTIARPGSHPLSAMLAEPRGASGTFTIPPSRRRWRHLQRQLKRTRGRQRPGERRPAAGSSPSTDNVDAAGADPGQAAASSSG